MASNNEAPSSQRPQSARPTKFINRIVERIVSEAMDTITDNEKVLEMKKSLGLVREAKIAKSHYKCFYHALQLESAMMEAGFRKNSDNSPPVFDEVTMTKDTKLGFAISREQGFLVVYSLVSTEICYVEKVFADEDIISFIGQEGEDPKAAKAAAAGAAAAKKKPSSASGSRKGAAEADTGAAEDAASADKVGSKLPADQQRFLLSVGKPHELSTFVAIASNQHGLVKIYEYHEEPLRQFALRGVVILDGAPKLKSGESTQQRDIPFKCTDLVLSSDGALLSICYSNGQTQLFKLERPSKPRVVTANMSIRVSTHDDYESDEGTPRPTVQTAPPSVLLAMPKKLLSIPFPYSSKVDEQDSMLSLKKLIWRDGAPVRHAFLRTRCAFMDNAPAIDSLKQGNRLCNNMYSIEKIQMYHQNKQICIWWENETIVLCRELPPLTAAPKPAASVAAAAPAISIQAPPTAPAAGKPQQQKSQQPPPEPAWEDPDPFLFADPETRQMQWQHSTGVACVTLQRSGFLIATGTQDGSVMVWDTRTGGCRRFLPKHFSRITSIAFLEDNHLATSAVDGSIFIHDITLKDDSDPQRINQYIEKNKAICITSTQDSPVMLCRTPAFLDLVDVYCRVPIATFEGVSKERVSWKVDTSSQQQDLLSRSYRLHAMGDVVLEYRPESGIYMFRIMDALLSAYPEIESVLASNVMTDKPQKKIMEFIASTHHDDRNDYERIQHHLFAPPEFQSGGFNAGARKMSVAAASIASRFTSASRRNNKAVSFFATKQPASASERFADVARASLREARQARLTANSSSIPFESSSTYIDRIKKVVGRLKGTIGGVDADKSIGSN